MAPNILINKAIVFASEAHKEQVRKISGLPYILHPFEVASIIGGITTNIETIIAGLLHDTIEDGHVDSDEIKELFGERVLELVLSETENKHWERPSAETWIQRKEESIQVLENSNDIGVKILWLADKLANLRSFYTTFEKEGNAMWNHFNMKNPAKQKWYYKSILSCISDLSDTLAYKEYKALYEKIFGDVND